jgi:hypothetical protein
LSSCEGAVTPLGKLLSATHWVRQRKVKLHALKGGLPSKVVSLYVVPVKRQQKTFFLGYGLFKHIWGF